MKNILFGILILFNLNAVAQFKQYTFEEQVHSADIIFSGQVDSIACHFNSDTTSILSRIYFGNIQIISTHKGLNPDTNVFYLEIPGGTIGDIGFHTSLSPIFYVGEDYILFSRYDGKIYANPLVGGNQGQFILKQDTLTGRKVVLNHNHCRLEKNETSIHPIPKPEALPKCYKPVTPIATTKGASALISDLYRENKQVARTGLTKSEFIQLIEDIKKTKPQKKNRIEFGDKKADRPTLQPDKEKKKITSILNANKGGILGHCGTHLNFPISFEVPVGWSSTDDFLDCFNIWNRYSEAFDPNGGDGFYGNANGSNEICGWLNDEELLSSYSMYWGDGIAMCIIVLWANCTTIAESDIVFNDNLSWSTEFEDTYQNPNIHHVDLVLMHELGHSWGFQIGTYPETYDYDVNSVMHGEYSYIVEDGRGCHPIDAMAFRQAYSAVPNMYYDIGIETYYADNGLNNASITPQKSIYIPGEQITLNNITSENMDPQYEFENLEVKFYLSTDRVLDGSDYEVASFTIPSLDFESYTVNNYSMNIPQEIPSGEYNILTSIYHTHTFEEVYFGNNVTFFPETITIQTSDFCQGYTELNQPTGFFTDGSGSLPYLSNSDCQWLINPNGATSITLTFEEFDTEANFDYLYVYDGDNSSASLLIAATGNSLPASITSTGNSLLVHFVSDESNNRQGWTIHYTSTTASLDLPVVVTTAIGNITENSASFGGEVLSQGNSEISYRGFCWSTSNYPEITDDYINCGTGTGSFVCSSTNLTPYTKYYLRAFATNQYGTSYGEQLQFTTITGIPTNDLIAYYPFNGNCNDESGNHNHGTAYGAILTNDRSENSNSAYLFDGTNDYIALHFETTPTITAQASLTFWINANEDQMDYAKVLSIPRNESTWELPYHHMAFSYDSPDNNLRYTNFDSDGTFASSSALNLEPNAWQMLTFVWNAGDIAIYLNDSLECTMQCSYDLWGTSTSSMSLGSRTTNPSLNGEFFSGMLDEVRLYGYALTNNEVIGIYNSTAGTNLNADINSELPHRNNRNNNTTDLKIHPNPSQDHIIISFATIKQSTVEIYSIFGKKVFSTMGYQKELQIKVSDLPNGIYLVQVSQAGIISNSKLIIAR